MASYQARNAQLRQTVCSVLASLKNVSLQSIPYPRSNARLAEYRVEIQAIRDTQAEFDRLGAIDPHPHYVTFGLMRLTEKIDTYTSLRSGWEFYRVEKVLIE